MQFLLLAYDGKDPEALQRQTEQRPAGARSGSRFVITGDCD